MRRPKIDPMTGERMIDPETGERVYEDSPESTSQGMGREAQGAFGEGPEAKEAAGSWIEKASALQPSLQPLARAAGGVAKFAGNVAQSLSTGPINAVAQAVQDKDGAGPVAWQATKNLVKSTINPFLPGPNPIQSTETSLERAGVPNEPRETTERIPGFLAKEWARSGTGGVQPEDVEGIQDSDFIERKREQPGRAKELGFAADAATPLVGLQAARAAGAVVKVPNAVKKVAKAAGEGLEAVGKDQMNRVIKPLMRHERKSRKPIEQVIFEQGLDKGKGGAAPAKIHQRSTEKLNELGKKLKAEIRAGRDGGARVNVSQIVQDAVADIRKSSPGESEDFYAMANDLEELAEDFIGRAKSASNGGDLDLVQAHAFKKYMGTLGAWQRIAESKGLPLAAKESSRSKLAEQIYHKLNDAIDAAAPNGIKDLNQQISELIPVNQAAGWRQVIDARGNAIKLDDLVGGVATAVNPKVWPILLFNRATKSGTVASKIYRLGEAMKAGTPSPKATALWAKLQKAVEETQKARIAELLAAELEASAPAKTIPFRTRPAAESDNTETPRYTRK